MKGRVEVLTVIAAIVAMGFLFAACDNSSSPTRCNHADYAWHITLAATCEDEGERELRCDRCDEVLETEMIAALGHDLVPTGNVATYPTCVEEGYGEAACARDGCDHTQAEGVIPALGHNLVATGEELVAPTCEEEGAWKLACDREACDHSEAGEAIPALEHLFADWIAPTCTEVGNSARTCTRDDCDHVDTRTSGYAALGHAPGNWVVSPAPTCTETGIETGTCAREGCDHPNEPRVVNALGHDMRLSGAATVAPTCVTSGLGDMDCARAGCDHTEANVVLPALGHEFPAWIAPTCTVAGNSSRACERAGCDHTETRGFVASLGHIWGPWARTADSIPTIAIFTPVGFTPTGVEVTRVCSRNTEASCNQTSNMWLDNYIITMANQGGEPVFLPMALALWTMGTADNSWTALLYELNRGNRRVVLDLSTSTMTGGTFSTGNPQTGAPRAGLNTIESIVLPSTTTHVGHWAFRSANLTSVTIPASVTTIHESAFRDTANLTSVTFATGSLLATIGTGAFQNTGLTSVTIPASITTINTDAFRGSANLTSVTVLSTTPQTLLPFGVTNMFHDTHPNLQIKVPAGSVQAYRNSWGWRLPLIEGVPGSGANRIVAIP